jgi:hypothetical protein
MGGLRLAMAGGAGGEAAKQGLLSIPAVSEYTGMRPPSGPMESAGRIAASAALEGGAQGAGSLISAGIKRLPRAFMGSAMKVPAKKSQQWRTMRQRSRPGIAPEVPADMIDAALEERLVLGGSPGFPGTKQVEALRGQSSTEADAMLKTIKRGRSKVSPPLNASVLLDDVWKLKASLKSSPRAAEDMAMVDDLADKFLASHRKVGKGGGIKFENLTPDEVNEIKTSAQRRIKDVYEKKGATLDEKNAINKRFLEALASGSRKKLEQEYDRIAVMLGRPTGDLAAANARTGRMTQLGEHIFNREAAPISYGSPIERLMIAPSIIRALGRPGVTSRLANVANAPVVQGPIRQTARELPRFMTLSGRNAFEDYTP